MCSPNIEHQAPGAPDLNLVVFLVSGSTVQPQFDKTKDMISLHLLGQIIVIVIYIVIRLKVIHKIRELSNISV